MTKYSPSIIHAARTLESPIGERDRALDEATNPLGRFGGVQARGHADVKRLDESQAPESPRLAELVTYWNHLRGDSLAPARNDIRPAEIPRLLPHLLLLEPLEAPSAAFRVRLAGTHVVNGLGVDPTGRLFSPGSHDPGKAWIAELARNAATVCTAIARGRRETRFAGRPIHIREGVAMPLSDDGAGIQMILGGLDLVAHTKLGPLAAS